MKISISLSFIVLTLLFSGCKKDSTDSAKFVRLSYDGIAWEDTDGTSIINKNTTTLSVTGSTTDAVTVITVKSTSGTGEYDLRLPDGTPGLSFQKKTGSVPVTYSISTAKPLSHGKITVAKVNEGTSLLNYIEGTFSGVAYNTTTDSVVITNGEFVYRK